MTKLTIVHIKDCTCCESVIKVAKELTKEMDIELKLQDWNESLDLIEANKIVSSPAIFILEPEYLAACCGDEWFTEELSRRDTPQ